MIGEGSVTLVTQRRIDKREDGRHSRRTSSSTISLPDPNLAAAALLYDMAALQSNERSAFGYKRAAKAIVALPVAVTDLVSSGTLREISFIGPASARIITEFVEQGQSPTVRTAVARAGRQLQISARQALRAGFLSHYALQQALGLPLGSSIVSRQTYRGDF